MKNKLIVKIKGVDESLSAPLHRDVKSSIASLISAEETSTVLSPYLADGSTRLNNH